MPKTVHGSQTHHEVRRAILPGLIALVRKLSTVSCEVGVPRSSLATPVSVLSEILLPCAGLSGSYDELLVLV